MAIAGEERGSDPTMLKGTPWLRGLALVAVFVPLVLAGGARGQQPSYRLVAPGVLTVATYASAGHAVTVLPNDTLAGLDGALLNAFAKDHGLRIHLYQTTFASVILAVEQGRVDIGTYYYYTAERARHVYYTYPFFQEHAFLFTLKSLPYSGPDSLRGKKVATVIGFVWAPYLQKEFGSNAILFPDSTAAATALLNGQVDGYVNSDDVLTAPPLDTAKNVAPHVLRAGDFGFPDSVIATPAYNFVRCDNKPLAWALDYETTKLHKSGAWAKMLAANHMTDANDAPLQEPQQLCQ
jgi:ABC-type amino acid transport substrate-binding protein